MKKMKIPYCIVSENCDIICGVTMERFPSTTRNNTTRNKTMNNEIQIRDKVYFRGTEFVVMAKKWSGSKFIGYTIGKTLDDVENCITVFEKDLYRIGKNKALDAFIKKVMKKSFGGRHFTVNVDAENLTIAYYTKHGGEENVEVPYANLNNIDIAEWFLDAYTDYDVNYETYIWLDNTGHGKDGAPREIADLLADKQEWEKCLDWLSTAAAVLRG